MLEKKVRSLNMEIKVFCPTALSNTYEFYSKYVMGRWAVNSDNKFVFKIRAFHCTPLEFRTGFLAGGLLI